MNYKKIELTIIGPEEDIKEFINVCRVIQLLGEVGANREIRIQVDGDGSARLSFYANDELIPSSELDYNNLPKLYIGE